MAIGESNEFGLAPEKLPPESVEVNQNTLRERVESHRPRTQEFLKRPYLVWLGMPSEFTNDMDLSEQESVPEVLRKLGPTDATTYSSDELNKKYRGGGMIIQPDGRGGVEAYPVTAKGIDRNTKLSSLSEALNLNPELAEMISENPALDNLLREGHVTGMMRSATAWMIKMSDIGYPLGTEVILPGKGAGQRKPSGEDAYLSIGQDKEGKEIYWIVNCDRDGLPVNYLRPEDVRPPKEQTL